MTSYLLALSFLSLLFVSACNRKVEKTPEMVRQEQLQMQAKAIEKSLAEIEEKMKGSATDYGMQAQLRNDRELARSRLARIKAALGEGEGKTEGGTAPAHH